MVILQAPTGFSLGGGGGKGGKEERGRGIEEGGERKRGNFKRGDNRYLHDSTRSIMFVH